MFISAIIPAYNEEKTIADIINTIKQVDCIGEIVVVNDGSTDKTSAISKECGAVVLELPENMGKGAAAKAGLSVSKGDIILLLDADLVGLNSRHIKDLLVPVISGQFDMSVGLFCSGRISTVLAHKFFPHLSGQRAMRRWVLENITNLENTGFGMEIALNRYAENEKARICEIKMKQLTHMLKEEKFGLLEGISRRFKMYRQICKGLKFAKQLK